MKGCKSWKAKQIAESVFELLNQILAHIGSLNPGASYNLELGGQTKLQSKSKSFADSNDEFQSASAEGGVSGKQKASISSGKKSKQN